MKEKFDEAKIELIYLENDIIVTSDTTALEDDPVSGNGPGLGG